MGSFIRFLCAVLLVAFGSARAAVASEPSALAQIGAEGVRVSDEGGTVLLTVPLSQAVPWKVSSADGPPRIVVGFGDVVWAEEPEIVSQSIVEVWTEKARPGWSELSLVLREPLTVASAEMTSTEDGTARLDVVLIPTTAEEFRSIAQEVEDQAPTEAEQPDRGLMVVAIDPGHGGVDPGAIAGDLIEADLVLATARQLKEVLLRTGRFEVVLTRDEDVFVSLETRLTRARAAGADVFLSLHADALEDTEDGSATGITVYRLPDSAAENADEILAERHAASDLLKGVDLTGTGDDVALALLELARRDTAPRTRALQRMLVEAFQAGEMQVNSRPERQGAYSVLKSAEIPSVLIELGFLSSDKDSERLAAEDWQRQAAVAVTEALMRWADEDRLRLEGLRQ